MESTEAFRPLSLTEPPNVEPLTAVVSSPAIAPAADTADSPSDHGLGALMAAVRAREFALIDDAIVQESAAEILAAVRAWFADLSFANLSEDATGAARSVLGRFDPSALTSAIGGAARGLTTARPRREPAADAAPPIKVGKVRAQKAVSVKPPAAPRAPRRLGGRVRWRRVITRGLLASVLAATAVSVPPEQYGKVADQVTPFVADIASQAGPAIANVADQVGPAIGNIAGEIGPAIGRAAGDLTTAIGDKLAAATAAPGGPPPLTRASFEVPPLSAYGAAFEAKAPNPTARPNATVEWVVALRNTGSAGWYRGIDGAQASLALADGTMAGVQTTDYVGPGQIGWFIVHFPAPSAAGVHKIALLPRIDGRGSLPDLGIYATVTVSPNQ